ncbi:MAG: hypothetical protein JO037_08510 [Actinobacteria bacterium]|nr:hypothetical protein [Actinomycetota bacterium]
MALYLGVPYHVGLGPDGADATLFSPAPPPDEHGFTAAGGHWRKQVSLTDLGALWRSRVVGEYRGEPCLVLDDLGDRLHVAYLGRDPARARQLGYWEIDREVFEVVADGQDVVGLTEERVEFPLSSAMFPPSHGEPAAPPEPETRGHGTPADSGGYRHAPRHFPRDPGGFPQDPGGFLPAPGDVSPDPGGFSRDGDGPLGAAAERRTSPLRAVPETAPPSGRRTGRRDRVPQSVFAELLSLAAIPQAAYAVDDEVPGAMCLIKADGGFEVFTRTDDARVDVRFFEDEEAAYFYLFGVLASEAVRSGRLRPAGPDRRLNRSRGAGLPTAAGKTFRSTYGAES